MTNTGDSVINGDLGVSPGMAVIGFPPGLVNGEIHAGDAEAQQAQSDVTTLYNLLASQPPSSDLSGVDLGGLTLVPGIYKFSSSAQLTGTLTLDAQGDADALFVFQIGSTLTTASNASVMLINGAQDCNVAWQVGSSATIGTSSAMIGDGTGFVGNVLALTSITITTGASLSGRALARNGAVTLDDNAITPAACGVGPMVAPRLSKAFSPATIASGGLSTLTITLSNADANGASTLTADLTDILPVGVTTVGLASTTCGGVANATATTLTLAAGATIPVGTATTAGTCTLSVSVTSLAPGVYVNTVPVGALQTTTGSNTTAASATLSVNSAITLTKAFNPASISTGEFATLIITLGNSSGAVANLTAALIDTLPSGMVIDATPAASTDCSGSGAVIAVAGANTVSLPATRSIAANSTCTVMVNVTAPPGASYLNTLPIGALTTDGGSNAIPTSAVLVVNVAPPAPTVTKTFVPAAIDVGGTSTLTLTLFNPTAAVATLLAPFTDTLPAGVTIAGAPSTTCGGVPSSDATSVSLPMGTTIPAGVGTAAGFCTLTVDVTSATPGLYVNVVPAGALVTNVGVNAADTRATLAVVNPNATPPTLSKTFNPPATLTGRSSTLTLTMCNDNAAPATLIAPFVDVLPDGLVIAATPDASTTCGGTGDVFATPGGTTLILPPPRTIPAFGCCTTTVRVTALESGTLVNTIPAGTLRTTNGDNPTVVESPLDVNDVVPAPVPALSEWALFMAMALMSLIAFVALRRRVT